MIPNKTISECYHRAVEHAIAAAEHATAEAWSWETLFAKEIADVVIVEALKYMTHDEALRFIRTIVERFGFK